jgi:hypothetical protein
VNCRLMTVYWLHFILFSVDITLIKSRSFSELQLFMLCVLENQIVTYKSHAHCNNVFFISIHFGILILYNGPAFTCVARPQFVFYSLYYMLFKYVKLNV